MARQGTVNFKFDARKAADEASKRLKLSHANRVWGAMQYATFVALNATPAWTGDTRANFRWSIGSKGSDYSPYNQHLYWRNKKFPIAAGSSDGASLASLAKMRSEVYRDPYQRFVFYNNVEYEGGMDIKDLDYGSLTGEAHMTMEKARQAISLRLNL